MRLHSILVLPFLLAVAACGAPAGGNNQLSATPGDDAGANSAAPGDEATGNGSAGLAALRARMLEGCIGGGRDAAPPGTPVERHCACALDRAMAGKTLEEIEAERASGAYQSRFSAEMRACIREIPS